MVLALWSFAAHADCSAVQQTFAVQTTLTDQDTPRAAELVSWEVIRGHEVAALGTTTDSCDEVGQLRITVARPEGDTDTDETIGYLAILSDGALPKGMELPTLPVPGPDVWLLWNDGATNDQDAFEMTLSLVSVDLAGNQGGLLEVEIDDDGRAAGTCDHTGSPVAAAWAVAGLALLSSRRRR